MISSAEFPSGTTFADLEWKPLVFVPGKPALVVFPDGLATGPARSDLVKRAERDATWLSPQEFDSLVRENAKKAAQAQA